VTQTQFQIGNALLKSLVDLRQKNGELNIESVGEMFEQIAASLHKNSSDDNVLHNEIAKISNYIAKARNEIASISSSIGAEGNPPSHIGTAGAELDEVVKATEEATNTILDSADIIQANLSKISDQTVVTNIRNSIDQIYLACNFQDITGQRIKKVLTTLDYLEHKIGKLLELVSDPTASSSPEDEDKFKDKRPDADLLNGPQLGKLPSQDDIDALFD